MTTSVDAPLLELNQVSVRFGGLVAVSEVSLSIPGHEIVGVIGPNGAGKSTLLNVVSGFVRPSTGMLRFNGANLTRLKPPDRARLGIGRTFQTPRLFSGLTVFQNLVVARRQRQLTPEGPFSMASTLEIMDIVPLKDKAVELLTSGERRFVELARALMLQPSLLLLDEPATGLRTGEMEALSGILQRLRDQFGVASLLISHDMRLVYNCCRHVAVMNEGSVLTAGPPAEVRADPAVIQAYFGTDLSR